MPECRIISHLFAVIYTMVKNPMKESRRQAVEVENVCPTPSLLVAKSVSGMDCIVQKGKVDEVPLPCLPGNLFRVLDHELHGAAVIVASYLFVFPDNPLQTIATFLEVPPDRPMAFQEILKGMDALEYPMLLNNTEILPAQKRGFSRGNGMQGRSKRNSSEQDGINQPGRQNRLQPRQQKVIQGILPTAHKTDSVGNQGCQHRTLENSVAKLKFEWQPLDSSSDTCQYFPIVSDRYNERVPTVTSSFMFKSDIVQIPVWMPLMPLPESGELVIQLQIAVYFNPETHTNLTSSSGTPRIGVLPHVSVTEFPEIGKE